MDSYICVLISVCLYLWMLTTDPTLNRPLICKVKLHYCMWKLYLLYEAQICVCWSEFATAGTMWLLISTDDKETATGACAPPLLPGGWCPCFSFCKSKSILKKGQGLLHSENSNCFRSYTGYIICFHLGTFENPSSMYSLKWKSLLHLGFL